MRELSVQQLLALLAAALLVGGSMEAAGPIGRVTAPGTFLLNQTTVSRNGTLMSGSLVATSEVAGTLHFSSGGTLVMAPHSAGKALPERFVLESGSGELDGRLAVEAAGLSVRPEDASGAARVALAETAARRVVVASLKGVIHISDRQGSLVASLSPGDSLEFGPLPEANRPAPKPKPTAQSWRVTGCLLEKGGHFLITDEVTKVSVEVVGTGLSTRSGNRVEVNGIGEEGTPVEGASRLVRAKAIWQIGTGCRIAASGGAAKQGNPPPDPRPTPQVGPAVSGAGMGSGAITAIIAGVGVAAGVGGYAATRKSSAAAQPSPTPPISR